MSKTRNKTNTASGAWRLAIVSAVILLRGPTEDRVFRIPAAIHAGLTLSPGQAALPDFEYFSCSPPEDPNDQRGDCKHRC